MPFCYKTTAVYCCIVILQCTASFEGRIHWNSTSETWLDLYKRYCGRVCRNGVVVKDSHHQCQVPSCFECDCDPTCIIYGTCCPSFDSTIDFTFNTPTPLNYSEAPPARELPSPERFFCSAFPGSKSYYYVISDCSPEYLHNLEQEQSNNNWKYMNPFQDTENGVSVYKRCVESNTDTFDDVTPYTDLQYGITFKNKFCALCNGYLIESNNSGYINDGTKIQRDRQSTIVGTVSAWTLTVSCYHYQNLFHVTSDLELFKSALKLGRAECRIDYTQPNISAKAKTCDPQFHHVTETTCSISDSNLQGHCLNLKHKFLRLKVGQTMFCYMCSGGNLSVERCDDFHMLNLDDNDMPYILRSRSWDISRQSRFSLLIGTSTPQPDVIKHVDAICNVSSEWPQVEGECEEASCAAGKLAEEGDLCKTAISQIRGLGYKLYMVLIPDSLEFRVSKVDIERLTKTIHHDLSKISAGIRTESKVRVRSKLHDSRIESLQTITVAVRLISNHKYYRDEFENKVLRIAKDARIMQAEDNTTARLVTEVLGEGFAPFLHDEDGQSVIEYLQEPEISKDHHFILNDTIDTNSTNVPHTSSYVEKLYTIHYLTGGFGLQQWQHEDKFIDITPSLTCPFIAIKFTNISFKRRSVVVNFNYKNINFTVASTENISLVSSEIRICLALFKKLTEPYHAKLYDYRKYALLYLAINYLEIISSFLSTVCLLISFVTYCLFPVLRTQPGLNNTCLIISLALAHILLFITVEFSYTLQLNPGYCVFHAISVHYFWLATFAWMSACCIHMYRAFTCQSTQFINHTKQHLHYCLFAFGSPVVIIVIYVVVCLCVTSGSSFGYSHEFCFLDLRLSYLTVYLSIVVPLYATILTNGVLFVLTIREMVHAPRVRRSTVKGKGVITYVKLSTLTGLSFVICALALHLHNPFITLFASPVMCLQGVFIFVSFICNKRVGNLYCQLFRRPRDLSQSSSRSNRTASTGTAADTL